MNWPAPPHGARRGARGFARRQARGSKRSRVVEQQQSRLQHDLQVKPRRPCLDVGKSYSTRVLTLSSVSSCPRGPLTCAKPVIPGFTRWRSAYTSTISFRSLPPVLVFSAWGRGPTIDMSPCSTFKNCDEEECAEGERKRFEAAWKNHARTQDIFRTVRAKI
jgi:hypothetical protein